MPSTFSSINAACKGQGCKGIVGGRLWSRSSLDCIEQVTLVVLWHKEACYRQVTRQCVFGLDFSAWKERKG